MTENLHAEAGTEASTGPVVGASLLDGRLPDFFVIGAMKSASSSLYLFLEEHPDVYLSTPKEPEYFSWRFGTRENYRWYKNLYAHARPGQVCGDCSTGYSRGFDNGNVAERIHAATPEAKIIYILRHPVERVWSHYRHLMNERVGRGERMLTFERAQEEIPEILDASDYAKYIRIYQQYFPRDQLKVILLDDMLDREEETGRELDAFIGVRHIPGRKFRRANVAGELSVRRKLKRFVNGAQNTTMGAVAKKVLPKPVKRFVRESVLQGAAVKALVANFTRTAEIPMKPDARQRALLLRHFELKNRDLAVLMGRDLPAAWSE